MQLPKLTLINDEPEMLIQGTKRWFSGTCFIRVRILIKFKFLIIYFLQKFTFTWRNYYRWRRFGRWGGPRAKQASWVNKNFSWLEGRGWNLSLSFVIIMWILDNSVNVSDNAVLKQLIKNSWKMAVIRRKNMTIINF